MWKRALWAAVAVSMVSVGGIVLAWWRNDWDLDAASMIGSAVQPFVGILTLFAVGAALLAVRAQERESVRQAKALEDQRTKERASELKAVYSPFLAAVQMYLSAVSDYMDVMRSTDGQVDQDDRDQFVAKIDTAHEDLERSLQPILLVDDEAERRGFRWTLIHEIRPVPLIPSTPNLKDWADVLLYRFAQKTEALGNLRNSLRRALGETVAEESRSRKEFEEKMRADLKLKADAIERRIGEEVKQRAIEAHQRGIYPR